MIRRRFLVLGAVAVMALPGAATASAAAKATATITTTVTDRGTHQPVTDICVFAVKGIGGFNWWDEQTYACSDGTGKVTIDGLVPGSYRLYVDTSNEADQLHGGQWVGKQGGTGVKNGAAVVLAVAGKAVAGPPVRLDGAGTITGRVTDAAGQPVPDVYVFPHATRPLDQQFPVQSSTGEDGTYTLTGLGPYAWPLLYAGSSGRSGPLVQWSGGRPSSRTADLIAVTAGGTTVADETIGPRAAVSGQVVFRDGTPANGATVWAYNADTGDVAAQESIVADEDGTFSLTGLTGPQSVRIAVRAGFGDPHGQVLGWYCHASTFGSATNVAVPSGGSASITVVIG